ncbi:hypothetical protein [Serratia proteamaculans]|uniref:hypothetical protein n=1 Tax=Serratia proteamaculans TaxID=28151 RepID=UPI00217C7703|nr:hypothetical protein [Serratia proteamaculans]CAI1172999.1 Uncharacterised protein [Serratia proteamaculans]
MAIKKSTNILGDTGGGGSSGDVKSVNHIQPGPDGDITVPMFGLGLGPVAKTDAYSNIAQFYRVNNSSANKPPATTGNVSAGVLCLPMDAAPSAGYFAVVGGSVAAYVGFSGAVAGGITWARIYTDKFQPPMYGLGAGPTDKPDAYQVQSQIYRVLGTATNRPGNSIYGVISLRTDGTADGGRSGYFAAGVDGSAYVGLSDADKIVKWARLYTDKFKPTLAELKALGNTGDQVLDGKLQLNHQLVLKSILQTDANVLAFKFGEDDDVIDVAIKATATPDNHGQLALGVRDDTGNVINALTIDGHSKAIMVQPGYKLYVGNSSVDLSTVTPFGLQLMACQDVAAARTLLGITG